MRPSARNRLLRVRKTAVRLAAAIHGLRREDVKALPVPVRVILGACLHTTEALGRRLTDELTPTEGQAP